MFRRSMIAKIVTCIFLITVTVSAQTTSVSVSPTTMHVLPSSNVTLNITIANVVNLHLYHVVVSFNNSVLLYTGTTRGSFLNNPIFFYSLPAPSPAVNAVTVDQALQGSAVNSGSGVLFTMSFIAAATGISPVTIDVTLRDGLNNTIGPVTINGGSVTVGNPSIISVNLNNGWNMVSLPNVPANAHYGSLYPSAVPGTLFRFNNGYFAAETLYTGAGYWLKSNASTSSMIAGVEINSHQVSLRNGWNMIGGISCAVPLNGISDPAGIIVPGTLYAFDNGYVQSTTIQTGKGYWIRTNAAGTIGLSCGQSAPAKFAPPDIAGSTPSLLIQDAAGSAQRLSFNVKLVHPQQALSFSLPAIPPNGAFDTRFAGDSRICEGDQATILMQSSHYPVLIEATDLPTDVVARYVLTEISHGREGVSHTLINGVPIHVSNPQVTSLKLEKVQLAPRAFALEQNYPNPFNPATTIRFTIGVAALSGALSSGVEGPLSSHVKLTVYDALGREVAVLANEVKEPGYYTAVWNGCNGQNIPVASGIYLYSMEVEKFSAVKKMVLVK